MRRFSPFAGALLSKVASDYNRVLGFYGEVVGKGGRIMNDEQIKEITIAAINSNLLHKYDTNEKIAEEIAKFINTLKEKVNN
jgi:predicted Rossmann-fold nucleotide-binding protein